MTNEPNKGMEPEHLIQTLKAVRLSPERVARMRADLSAYADLHSVLDGATASVPSRSVLSLLMVRTRSLYAGALALVVIVAGGAQMSQAAEGAVPGDILYPVKVALAEPLALALAGSEGKAEYSAQFASRRVDEAAALSKKGKLDEVAADKLASRFEAHVDTLTAETAALEAQGDIAFSLAIRTDLEQKLSTRAEDFAVQEVAGASVLAADSVQDSSGLFATRIAAKSRQLATTREHLESVLAVDMGASAEAPVNLAVLRDAAPAPASASPMLFSAKLPEGSVVMMMSAAADAGTTTEATSTPQAATTTEQSKARFFSPFIKR